MSAHCKCILFIHGCNLNNICGDICRIIIQLLCQINVFHIRSIGSDCITYIHPNTNKIVQYDRSTKKSYTFMFSRAIALAGNVSFRYTLDFHGTLKQESVDSSYNFDTLECSRIRCVDRLGRYVITTTGELCRIHSELHIIGIQAMNVFTNNVYKLQVTPECVYWLTNAGKVFGYGVCDSIFPTSSLEVRGLRCHFQVNIPRVIDMDMTIGYFQRQALITSDYCLHYGNGDSEAKTISYADDSRIKDAHRIVLQSEGDIYFYTPNCVHWYWIRDNTLKYVKTALTKDIIWDGYVPLLDENGKNLKWKQT